MSISFVWKDEYSVKVPSLDEQHKGFFEITNQIITLLDKPRSDELKENLILALVRLGRYALYHLDYEEQCINRYKCDGWETHAQAHDLYREKVKDYLGRVRIENSDIYALAREAADFSQTWLSTHILNKDREYITCLSGRGLQ